VSAIAPHQTLASNSYRVHHRRRAAWNPARAEAARGCTRLRGDAV